MLEAIGAAKYMSRKSARIGALLNALLVCGSLFQARIAEAENAATHATPRYVRTEAEYAVTDIPLVRKDGSKVAFSSEANDGRLVMLNFVYASCNTICPMLSFTFAKVQNSLGADLERVHLMSLSIDPENDTPQQLVKYAGQFKAGSAWDHYTGTLGASIAIQKAFNTYRGDKMNHESVVFLRESPGKPWVRLQGVVSPDDLVREIHQMLSHSTNR
jgi:protein SCO1